jgi:acyl carrier protein
MDEFIRNLVEIFEDADTGTIRPEAKFRDLEGYSSLIALSIIAMADEAYNLKLKGEDIRNSITVEDLYKVVMSRR